MVMTKACLLIPLIMFGVWAGVGGVHIIDSMLYYLRLIGYIATTVRAKLAKEGEHVTRVTQPGLFLMGIISGRWRIGTPGGGTRIHDVAPPMTLQA